MERKNSSLHIPFPRILFRKVKLFEEWFGSLGKYDIYMWVLIFSIGWVAGTLSQFVFLLNEANPINLMQSTCSPVKSPAFQVWDTWRVKFSQKLYRYISPRKIDRYRRWTKCPFKILSLFSGPEDRLGGFQPPENPFCQGGASLLAVPSPTSGTEVSLNTFSWVRKWMEDGCVWVRVTTLPETNMAPENGGFQ